MKISFIVPVYNCEATIERCINSILAQKEKDFELILVDDGSKDGSQKICNYFKQKDNRITVLTQQNKGPGAARNAGIAAATGKYIAFVDSDDYIEKDYIDTVLKCVSVHNPDMVFFGFMFRENQTGELLKTVTLPEGVYQKADFPHIVRRLISADIFGYQWCKVIKSDIIKNNNLALDESISLHEDLLFTCECTKKAEKIAVISKPLYHYIKGIEGLCEKYRADMGELMDYVNEKLFSFYKEIHIDGLEEMILDRAVFTCFLILKNDRNLSFREIRAKKDKIKGFLSGFTTKEIKKRMNIYKTAVKGKKKWFYYVLIKTKSLLLYYLISKKYK